MHTAALGHLACCHDAQEEGQLCRGSGQGGAQEDGGQIGRQICCCKSENYKFPYKIGICGAAMPIISWKMTVILVSPN